MQWDTVGRLHPPRCTRGRANRVRKCVRSGRVGLLGRVHGAQQTVREVQGWPLVQHRNLWKTYVGTVTLWARADNILKYSVAMKKGWELGHAHEWVKNYAQAGKPDKGKTPEVGRGQTGCFERARKKVGSGKKRASWWRRRMSIPLACLRGSGGRIFGWRGIRVGEARKPGPYTVGGSSASAAGSEVSRAEARVGGGKKSEEAEGAGVLGVSLGKSVGQPQGRNAGHSRHSWVR